MNFHFYIFNIFFLFSYLFILIFPNHKFGALSLTIFAFIYGRKKISRRMDDDDDDDDAIGLIKRRRGHVDSKADDEADELANDN